MDNQQTRREFLMAAGTAAALSAVSLSGRPSPAAAADNPNLAAEFEYHTTRELVGMLAARKVSSVELVDQAIKRIEALDGRINAVVVHDFERARAAAVAADAALAAGERRPLLGIPMTVKEAYNVAGLPTTWGFPRFKDYRPTEDAIAVARVKAAGAVILGKTNVPLNLGDWQSYNDIYGTTGNPWDLSRTPGGSSGGAAASLAAGYVSLELGSDIGGSLRVPAHYCGVFSHKPSKPGIEVIPHRGHAPPGVPMIEGDVDLAVVGPMARSAGDLALALDVLAGPDEVEAVAWKLDLPPPRHDKLREFRVLVLDSHPLLPASSEVRGALDRLADRLAAAGCTVARQSPLLPHLEKAAQVYMQLLLTIFGADLPSEQYHRLEGIAAGVPSNDGSLGVARLRGLVLSHRDWIQADRIRSGIRWQWHLLFKEWDVVLKPVMPTTAFPHDHSADLEARRIDIDGKPSSYLDQLAYPGVATLVGLPSTAAPLERSPAGLPIGVEIIGPMLEDRSTIAFAGHIEREFGGFVPPPALKG